MRTKPTEEIIAFLQPYAQATGVEIVDAEWNGRDRSLTVFIDMPGGLDLVTCEKFHHAIDEPLDELDPTFGEPYTLNCSSPGLDRPFRTARDYERNLGKKTEVRLYAPIDGKKKFVGTLLSYDGQEIVLSDGKNETRIPVGKIAKCCLYIEI